MPLTKFTGATDTIQSLGDRPNQDNGLTPAQLKLKFDKHAIDNEAYLNDVLTVELDGSLLTANTNASNAVTTANNANTNASNAVSTANTANANSTNAVNIASTASTTATNAVNTANSASTTATNANNTATAVQTDYNLIKPQLEQAVLDVDSKASVEYVDGVASNFTQGAIPNNSLSETKMANDMKKDIVGGVASYNGVVSYLAEKANKDGTVQVNLNAQKFNSKTAAATPLTTEKTDVIGMVNELFTNANNGKQNWVDVIGSPLLATDTFATLKSKTQTLKNTMATNLTNKGQSSVGTESLNNLVNKVANIVMGKKWSSGTTTSYWDAGLSKQGVMVRGLPFQPKFFMCAESDGYGGFIRPSIYMNDGVNTLKMYVVTSSIATAFVQNYSDGIFIESTNNANTRYWFAFE